MLMLFPTPDVFDGLWKHSLRVKDTIDGEEYVIFRCESHGDQVASDPMHFPAKSDCQQCAAIGFLYRKTINQGSGRPSENLYGAMRNADQDINSGKWDYAPLDKAIVTITDDDEEEPKDRIILPN